MKNKVIDLFSSAESVSNKGTKYSDLLNDLIKPFEDDFSEEMDIDDVINFSMNAWNMGCMSLIVPEKEFAQLLVTNQMAEPEGTILKKMIALKKKKFAEYDRFISDFGIEEKAGELVLTVATQDKESFLETLMDEPFELQPNEADFDEGYINRYAVILKPKQPFYDWANALNPNDPFPVDDEANIYLVKETDDYIQDWLRKKFDRFFMTELEQWHTNKKDWPQKRSYKMFKDWFDIEISTMIYDFEKQPIYKEV